MSTYTYKLKGARWLRMWTAADRSSVYAAQSEAQKIADTLCDVPWTRAKSDGPAMFPLTAAKSLDENPANRDLFDAALFCADHSDGAHRAYANAAMYLFELPTTTGVHLNSVKVHVESDAYNALGARVAVHLLDDPVLPTDCATVRTGAAHAEGVAARRTVERDGRNYWYSNSTDVTITGGTSESPAAIGELKQYLAVFVGMENYATSRNEWLEGASYIRNLIEIETDAVVTGWTDGGTYDCSDAGPAVLLAGGSSPTWLQPLPTVNAYSATPPELADVAETFFTDQQTKTTQLSYTVTESFETTSFEGTYTISAVGTNVESVSVRFREKGQTGYTQDSLTKNATIGGTTYAWGILRQVNEGATSGLYLRLCRSSAISIYVPTGESDYSISTQFTVVDAAVNGQPVRGETARAVGGLQTVVPYSTSSYYLMLQLLDGVPVAMDRSGTPTEAGRQNLPSSVSGAYSPWTVALDGTDYTVETSDSAVTLKLGAQTLGAWTSIYDPSDTVAFDIAANVYLPGTDAHRAVMDYGLAAALGDFSHAVATFEAGTQPPNAEVLGRLARMSKKSAQGMLYLHPAVAALADELDVLRPVPRFWRSSSNPSGQTSCQPGLSVWYYRPHTTAGDPAVTTVSPSAASAAFAYRDMAVSVVKVANPVFLQLALLALRAPSEFSTRLVLENKIGGSNASEVLNSFKLRFVAWVSPADEWDGSNAFAMAAMASMPSVYRSDGEASVSWQVDCSGSLMPLGVRTMTARRIGVSEVVAANIAAGGHIDIPLDARVGEGDVVLIAPEVLGFNAGTDDDPASAYFGRQADPASAASKGAWARYTADLGWFPKVTGE